MKTFRAWILSLAGVLAVVGLAGWASVHWRQAVINRQDAAARSRVASLLVTGQSREAVALIRQQPRPFRHADWSRLEVRALAGTRAVQALNSLYHREPAVLLHDEEASLLLLRAWLAAREIPIYEQLRQSWRGREETPARWTLVDADALLWAGQRKAVVELLRSKSYSGRDEAGRLLRLALAVVPQDRSGAWDYLSRANLVDPRNPDIRSFRAHLLEASGRAPEARVEYVAAVLADSANPLLRDQLAEFYRRQGSLDLAVQTWQEALAPPSLDYIWVKALFWSRVIQPFSKPLPGERPEGSLAPLVALLRETPRDRFYRAEVARGKPALSGLTRERPETFWLAVLDYVRAGRESEALKLLESGLSSARELQPELDAAFRQILTFRLTAVMPVWTGPASNRAAGPGRHSFFDELEKLRQPPHYGAGLPALSPTLDFLKGPHAFSAACLAAGWREAALSLCEKAPLPPDAPEWYVYALAQALRYNRNPETALKLLAARPATPLLEVLSAEFLILLHRGDEGCARLVPLASRVDDIGLRAAWLLAVSRLEQGRGEEVRAIVAQQPALARSVTGRELEARVELAAGRLDKADAIYRAVAGDSIEARVWLARRAVWRKDWGEARTLTRELMTLMPEEMELRQSLLAIESAARNP